jgi:hypothetical protein
MADRMIDDILDLLHRHHQRATYGALGGVVDRPARYLTAGWPRDHRHSWVVNRLTGLPTGYGPGDMHPKLRVNAEVLQSTQQLEDWLRDAR